MLFGARIPLGRRLGEFSRSIRYFCCAKNDAGGGLSSSADPGAWLNWVQLLLFRVIGPLHLISLLIPGTLRQESEWQIGESNASCGYKRA
jgi:hypothetical protein